MRKHLARLLLATALTVGTVGVATEAEAHPHYHVAYCTGHIHFSAWTWWEGMVRCARYGQSLLFLNPSSHS